MVVSVLPYSIYTTCKCRGSGSSVGLIMHPAFDVASGDIGLSVSWSFPFLWECLCHVRSRRLPEWRCSGSRDGAVRQTSPSISIGLSNLFYKINNERHSDRAASRLSLNVLRFESALCELNRLWNEAWIEANFCRLCMRLNRSIALSRRRNGRCEFSTLLFAHRSVTCFSEKPSSFAAAL